MTEEEWMATRRHRTAGAFPRFAPAIAGLIIAGCSGGSGTPTVASLPGHGGAGRPGPAPVTVAQSDADMVKFARCMRAHGVQMSVPFHVPGHDGFSIDLPPHDASTAAAYRACNQFIQPLVQAKQNASRPDPGPRARRADEVRAVHAFA
jgi:hypothetical protein